MDRCPRVGDEDIGKPGQRVPIERTAGHVNSGAV